MPRPFIAASLTLILGVGCFLTLRYLDERHASSFHHDYKPALFHVPSYMGSDPHAFQEHGIWDKDQVESHAEANGDWNILYHLGGNSPWIRNINDIIEGGIAPPEGCSVEQVHMMSRHAERFPTKSAGGRMLDLLQRIRNTNISLEGDLKFVNDWEYFIQDPSRELDQLISTGPYAGTLSAFKSGTKLRTRYSHLIPHPSSFHQTHLWASGSHRVIESARYFSTGFFGLDWASSSAALHIIPETTDLGADTLTPGDTCVRYRNDTEYGHDYGVKQLVKYRSTYLPAIRARFQDQNSGIVFSDEEIYGMQEICGFETLVRGHSLWCNAFTHEDWLNFEYARDVIHYYRSGPGNKYGPVIGWLWLNATSNLLEMGPDNGTLFFSFVHDGDIIPMLAALDLFPSAFPLPLTHNPISRTWRTSQVVPMSGRIIFERLKCQSSPNPTRTPPDSDIQVLTNQDQKAQSTTFIRININDGIVALPGCDSGPGSSCPLEEFLARVRRRGDEIGDFRDICGLDEKVAGRITFLHQ